LDGLFGKPLLMQGGPKLGKGRQGTMVLEGEQTGREQEIGRADLGRIAAKEAGGPCQRLGVEGGQQACQCGEFLGE
jgi:hypothetical protein